MSCKKNQKNDNNNQMEIFSGLDFISDQIYTSQRTENHVHPKLNRNKAFRKIRNKKPRVENNSDCSGLDLAFERKVNDFTNPKSNPNNRRRCVPQEFEFCRSNFIMDYENSEVKDGNKSPSTKACCDIPSITGGIKPFPQCKRCYNWNNCTDCQRCPTCEGCLC